MLRVRPPRPRGDGPRSTPGRLWPFRCSPRPQGWSLGDARDELPVDRKRGWLPPDYGLRELRDLR